MPIHRKTIKAVVSATGVIPETIAKVSDRPIAAVSRALAKRFLGSEVAANRTTTEIAGRQIRAAAKRTGFTVDKKTSEDIYHGALIASFGVPLMGGTLTFAPLAFERMFARGESQIAPFIGGPELGPFEGRLDLPFLPTSGGPMRGPVQPVRLRAIKPRRGKPGMGRAVKAGIVKRDKRGRLIALTARQRKECEVQGLLPKRKRKGR